MDLARLIADGRDVAIVELATTPLARARGLLGRSGLPPGRALWLAPCRAIHTVGMRFVIDLVFLDREHRVVTVFDSLEPYRLAWGGWRSYGVLEFAGGEAGRLGLSPGLRLELQSTAIDPSPR